MNEHSQPPRTSVSSNVVDLDANVVPIFLSLVDVLQKGLTAPEVKGGGEEEAVDALERWQHREELGGMTTVRDRRGEEEPNAIIGAAPLRHKQGGGACLRGRRRM